MYLSILFKQNYKRSLIFNAGQNLIEHTKLKIKNKIVHYIFRNIILWLYGKMFGCHVGLFSKIQNLP